MGWTAVVRLLALNFSLLRSVHQTGSAAHPASYNNGYQGLFHKGVKRPGREADHSPPSSAEVTNGGVTPPLPNISSWRGA
jgi:hypothetical protein